MDASHKGSGPPGNGFDFLRNQVDPSVASAAVVGIAVVVAARARGRVGGRPPTMTTEKIKIARQMYDSRVHTVEAIAKTLEVSRKTIYRHLEQAVSAQ
ncbi:MAG: helix-turn-helix domain-containing protein [Acidimicrobiales bacterium]